MHETIVQVHNGINIFSEMVEDYWYQLGSLPLICSKNSPDEVFLHLLPEYFHSLSEVVSYEVYHSFGGSLPLTTLKVWYLRIFQPDEHGKYFIQTFQDAHLHHINSTWGIGNFETILIYLP